MVEQLISDWGYLGVFVLVAVESFGIPAPGETALIAAAVVAARGDLEIAKLLVTAAAAGIIGDNVGFWVGRRLGFPLLRRYGSHVGMPAPRMKLLQYLFLRYGTRIVFAGRFIMILRAWEAFLAGADQMPWRTFAISNAAAVVLWVGVWGLSAYLLGHADVAVIEWVSLTVSVALCGIFLAFFIYFRRHEDSWRCVAEEALPGPLRPRRRGDEALPARR